jgi:sialic acid synthase SpsE
MPVMGAPPPVPFGRRYIGPDAPAVVIAEIGINHEGDRAVCLRLVEAAARAGADAIKLQTADPNENYAPGHPSHALYAKARLGRDGTAEAFAVARRLGIEAFTTTGLADLEWIAALDPAAFKISSGLMAHLPLIRRLAGYGRSLIMSTGMSEADEIDEAVSAARSLGCRHMVVMQCTSLYPAPDESISLATINWLAERYGMPGGFSDHTTDEDTPALAVAAGARVIEKHFTLDTGRAGFDHHISLDEAGFSRMTARVRRADKLIGRPAKGLSALQKETAARMRRTLVAARAIKQGATITADDIAIMRPPRSDGALLPRDLDRVLGRKAARTIEQWSAITADSLI